AFMTINSYISNLLYLALNEYIKIDMEYKLGKVFEIKINDAIITEKGEKYFSNNNIVGFKKNKNLSLKYAKALKKTFINREKDNVNSQEMLKELLASKYLQ
ncbi:hypothetical protein QUF55_09465, partial [Clostridiaceae bacterium HSG29]|nr:hypothetical protein [Clostridiaceae bacterium HSG29]